MLDSVFSGGSLNPGYVVLALGLAIVLGTIAALYYTRRNVTTRSFAMTLAVLPLITATVILVVNGNLGAGIAVAGSFSLIRFRSAQGSGQEILSVFLAASLGLCLGAGYIAVACLLLLLYLAALTILGLVHLGEKGEQRRELKISIPEVLDYEGLFDDLLNSYADSWELDRVKTIEMGSVYQLVYQLTPKDITSTKGFLDSIRSRNGNLPVSLGKIPQTRESM